MLAADRLLAALGLALEPTSAARLAAAAHAPRPLPAAPHGRIHLAAV